MQYEQHNEREALESAVFAYGWFDYEETRDTEGYVQRWRTFRAALDEEHSGDCTSMPWSCSRCAAESVVEIADWFEQGVQTADDDNLNIEWRCYLCGKTLTAIAGPVNRWPVHYSAWHKRGDYRARRGFGAYKPTILVCDSCSAKLKGVDTPNVSE